MNTPAEACPPLPPFTEETAIQKIRAAEDGWNSRDPARVASAYTPDSRWRNRAEFPAGREQIAEFPTRKRARELDCRLIKELRAFGGNRIAVRFASISDLPITDTERKFFWPLGPCPGDRSASAPSACKRTPRAP